MFADVDGTIRIKQKRAYYAAALDFQAQQQIDGRDTPTEKHAQHQICISKSNDAPRSSVVFHITCPRNHSRFLT